MASLKEYSELCAALLQIFVYITPGLVVLWRFVRRSRPLLNLVFALVSLIIPYGVVVWKSMYTAVEISDYLRENPQAYLLLVAELAGVSIVYTPIWGWITFRLYPKLRARSEDQKQIPQRAPNNDKGVTP